MKNQFCYRKLLKNWKEFLREKLSLDDNKEVKYNDLTFITFRPDKVLDPSLCGYYNK